MRELEASLQQFGQFILTARLVKEQAAPYCVRWVRRFLTRPASDEPLADQVRTFCETLEREGRWADWQVRQAEHALRIYFVHFLKRTDWHTTPPSAVVDERGHASPLAALDLLRCRLRTRHYSYRTECTYVDWVRRFMGYLIEQQGVPHPRVESQGVSDFATHLAVHRRVSASTQNQALSAVLFFCREVLGLEVDNLGLAARAKRGIHLPVVLSMPETTALLGAMSGTTWLMAALIYGGGLRVSECCELRIKDLDFDQGLVFVRDGKGGKDRSTLLAELARDELRRHLQRAEAQYRADRAVGLAGVWLPDSLERKYPNAGSELGWFWVFPSHTLSTDPRAGVVRRHHISDSVIQKAVKAAAIRAKIHKPVSVHTLRHSFATHLLLNGVDIRQIQEYFGAYPRRDDHDLHTRGQGIPYAGTKPIGHSHQPFARFEHVIASLTCTAHGRLGAAHTAPDAADQVLCKHVQHCGYSGDCAVSRRHLRPAVDTCPGPAAAEAHVADHEEPRTNSGTR